MTPRARKCGRATTCLLRGGAEGDFEALLELLRPNVVLRSDFGVVGASKVVHRAKLVARQALFFSGLALEARSALVYGAVGAVVMRDGIPFRTCIVHVREMEMSHAHGKGSHMNVGFIGLGTMGQPMALNLIRAGHPLTVWNRSPHKCVPLRDAGATIVDSVADVFRRSDVVFLMLVDCTAIDDVLRRGTRLFAEMLSGRTVVNMSSVEPDYSRGLEKATKDAGGRFVEAPVSGSRVPAESGQLVAMVAGDQSVIADVSPLLRPMCHEVVYCGSAGSALRMKLAVNIFMLTLATGLAEAVHFADRHRLDRQLVQTVLNASALASAFSRMKLAKLVADDYSPQALARDGCNSTRLITNAARNAHVATGLMDVCRELYEETVTLGHGSSDMISVIRAIEARSDRLS